MVIKRIIAAMALLLVVILLPTPAWCANDLEPTATRNSDGTLTVRWNKDYFNGTGEFEIFYKWPQNWTYIKIATVPISEGFFVHKDISNSPNSTINYKIEYNFMYNWKFDASPYQEQPVDDDGSEPPGEQGDGSGSGNPFDSIFIGDISEVENNAGYIERFLAEIVMIVPQFINDMIGITEPMQLVFNRDVENSMAPIENLHLWTFTDGEFAAIGLIYNSLRELIPIPLTIAVALMGFLLMFNSTSSNNRLTSKDYLLGIILCVTLIQLGHYLWKFIFGLNYYLVEALYSTIEHRVDWKGFIGTLCKWDTASFGMAIITFVAVLIVAIMTWQYAFRKIMLAILLIIFPVVALVGVFPQTRSTLAIWIKELLANLLLQAGHAAALALFILFTSSGASFWVLLAFLLGMNSIAGVVRRVIGAETFGSGAIGGMGTMLGLGSIIALSRMGKGVMGGTAAGMTTAAAGVGVVGAGAAGTGAMTAGALATGSASGAVSGLVKGAGVAAAALTGGVLAGVATGNPGIGIMAGGMAGANIGNKFDNLYKFVSSVGQEADASGQSVISTAANRLGIFDAGQLYDTESASRIGRNMLGNFGLLGSAGALGGLAVSTGAKALHAIAPEIGKNAAETGNMLSEYRQTVTRDMLLAQQNISNLAPQYEMAKQQLEMAKSPAFIPDDFTREQEIEKAQANLHNINGQMAESRLTILDGQYALSNPGVQEKLAELKDSHSGDRVNGGVYGYKYRD